MPYCSRRRPARAAINGPKVYACGPRHPFLYRIPATGQRPMNFTAEGLPAGLALDADTGILRGAIAQKGEYRVTLRAENPQGRAERPLKIVCGETLALTPPMGWNSWYIHYNRVTEAHLREAARQMIASGMADYGYQYVNIDDCWMKKQGDTPYRDAAGRGAAQRQVPRHQGHDRRDPRRRAEGGHLYFARSRGPAAATSAPISTKRPTPGGSPSGASIS